MGVLSSPVGRFRQHSWATTWFGVAVSGYGSVGASSESTSHGLVTDARVIFWGWEFLRSGVCCIQQKPVSLRTMSLSAFNTFA